MAEHNSLTGSSLHEPKGADTATNRDVYVADGAASGSFMQPMRIGFWDYNDTATTATPITLTPTATAVKLTNNGLGSKTNKTYKLDDVAEVWNTSTNQLDFSGLNLGDTVDIRFDITVTTTGANHEILLDLQLAIGATPYTLQVQRINFKTAGTYSLVVWFGLYMGDANTLNNPGEIRAQSDTGTTDTVVVNGWYIRTTVQGEI
jgi:hypothetical protein